MFRAVACTFALVALSACSAGKFSKVAKAAGDVPALLTLFAGLGFIQWTKLTLGALLVLAGALLPLSKRAYDQSEAAVAYWTLKLGGLHFDFRGGLRLAIVFAGLIVLLGTLGDSLQELPSEAPAASSVPEGAGSLGPLPSKEELLLR